MKRQIMEPSPIENTIVSYYTVEDSHTVYYIEPMPGYVVHDNEEDYTDENGTLHTTYRTSTMACINYNFEINPRDFYAVLKTEVPADCL